MASLNIKIKIFKIYQKIDICNIVLAIALCISKDIFDLTLNIKFGHLKFIVNLFRRIDEIFALCNVSLKRVI